MPSAIDSRSKATARVLRDNATPAERRLWCGLREMTLGETHFRRQVPIGKFIADFACHACRVVIEVDGGQHFDDAGEARDAARTEWLESQDYRVIRFANSDVMRNLAGVLEAIEEFLQSTPTPNSSPQGGGEGVRPENSLQTTTDLPAPAASPPPCGEGLGVGVAFKDSPHSAIFPIGTAT